jgi:hypothetical protein
MRRALIVAAVALAWPAVGCVGVQRMPLDREVVGAADGVQGTSTNVAASRAFLAQRGNDPSVLAVTVTTTNRGDGDAFLELERATLVLADPGGERPEIVFGAWSAGAGEVPDAIGRAPVGTIPLARGEATTFWIAFRSREKQDLVDRDVPRRIVVRIPVAGASRPLELVIAEPVTGQPRWNHPPVRHANYAGVSVMGTPFDEGSFGILRSSGKTVVGEHVVLGPSFYFGVRGGELRGERERTIVCCDLGLSFDVGLPFFKTPESSFGPWLSYQGVFALERGRIDKATWHGPAAGLQFHTRLIEPIVAGALPVRRVDSPLGYSSFTVAYVHLFRRGDEGGSPAMLLLFERTLPEW